MIHSGINKMTPQEQLLNFIKEIEEKNSYSGDFLLFSDNKFIKLEEIDFNKKSQIFIIPTEIKPIKIIFKEN